jgi:hypothetical protein
MPYTFEQLEVWKLSLEYMDLVSNVAKNLPRSEEYNLKSRVTRAANSMALHMAEGSQGQSDAEQAPFLFRTKICSRKCMMTHRCPRRNYKSSANRYQAHNITFAKIFPDMEMTF